MGIGNLDSYYEHSYWHEYRSVNIAKFHAERVQKNRPRFRFLSSLMPQKGKILDIGCGSGYFLELFAEAGWEVTGIEPDKEMCDYGISRGFRILNGMFGQATIDSVFDLVTIIHTLEHMENPYNILSKINDIMRYGGLLYIECPNVRAGKYTLLPRSKYHIKYEPRHVQYFCEDSLRVFVEGAGFIIVKMNTYDYWRLPDMPIYKAIPVFMQTKFKEQLGVANAIRCVATKPK